jgi:nicotinate-nucleotide pyrophosphorylase (carboxylating)
MFELNDSMIEPIVRAALAEDIGDAGDITSNALIAPDAVARAKIINRKEGVVCGLQPMRLAFQLIDPSIQIQTFKKDGDVVKAFDHLATIAGPVRALLLGERVALNFMMQLSGVATLTRSYVNEVTGTKAKII